MPGILDIVSKLTGFSASSFRSELSTFPKEQILVIALVRSAEPIAFTSLFPYVYFMVRDFQIAATDADIAKYAGYLSSIFAFSQFLTCYQWGKFADKYGRKPTIVIGLSGSIMSLLILGFSENYYWAFFARCLNGMLNGNVAVIRTLIGENVGTSKKEHQALAFATMPLIWQAGSVIGPMIGGFLSGNGTIDTTVRLSGLKEKFPYALPNIVLSGLLGFSLLVAVFFLEETHHQHKFRRDYFIEVSDWIKVNGLGFSKRERPWYTFQPKDIHIFRESSEQSAFLASHEESIHRHKSSSVEETSTEEQSSWKVLSQGHIFFGVVCNFLMSLHLTINDEFFPVYLAYDIVRDPKTGLLVSHFPFNIQGGLSYNSEDTGQLLSLTGIFGIFVLLVVFPYVNHHYNTLTIYKSMIIIFPICYTLTPYLTLLANHKSISMVAAYCLTSFKTLAVSISTPQIIILVHNTSPPKQRGMINGAIISISALARTTGPLIWGYVFAFSENHAVGWVSWWGLTAVSLLAIYVSKYLKDDSIEIQEDIQLMGQLEDVDRID
ncbi:hypothetical protein WICPIJ_005722 [Wickerhamomyces pijperi]|uniref:Major facilitator superfamily (MFS) profile domain-containing protein n=1 Tax=Wickerhamomyces pijperi TaxID=599730 RepID=A0A9P8Q3B2_WICPI|nr:hypothetical protein WICPIJ_005722 [Wickerhamomyces pijperi]